MESTVLYFGGHASTVSDIFCPPSNSNGVFFESGVLILATGLGVTILRVV